MINTATAHSKGITVTASVEGVPTALHIEADELRFGAESLAIRVLELTAEASRAALREVL